jgi:large subunit ribosomal protein L18
MDAQKAKAKRAQRRRFRVRKTLHGTPAKPRLSVYRSNFHIYAQLIDDDNEVTVASASSNDKGTDITYGGNVAAALIVGRQLAEKAKALGITAAAFDRGHYRFHGRVKALARAATEAGLVCTGLVDEPKKHKAAPEAPAKGEKKKGGGDKGGEKKPGGDKKPAGEKKEKGEKAKA